MRQRSQTLIDTANSAADLLCKKIREEVAPQRGGKTYLEVVQEAVSHDGSGSSSFGLTDDWQLRLEGQALTVAYAPEGRVQYIYGAGRCRSAASAMMLLTDIMRSGGPTDWITRMLQCILTWTEEGPSRTRPH